MHNSSAPARKPWDAERELERGRGVERKLVWKELAVIAGLLVLLTLRIVFTS